MRVRERVRESGRENADWNTSLAVNVLRTFARPITDHEGP